MLERGASRIVPIAGAVLLAAALAWPIIGLNMSDEMVQRGRFTDALSYDPRSPRAATAAGEVKLDPATAREAITLSRQAIENSTLSGAALRNWAVGAQMSGDLPLSARLMGQAAALGWRDTPTQLWLVVAALQAGDIPATLLHVDALTRTVGMDARVQAILDDMAAKPETRAEFIRLLARRPFWRTDYFNVLDDIGVERLTLRAQALVSLRGTQAPPSDQEVMNVTNLLARAGAYVQAFNLWRLFRGATVNTIIDGGLERVDPDAATTTPFEWRVPPLVAASATLDPAPGGGRWLHVTEDGTASGTIARQVIVLTPGAHTLSVATRLAGPGAANAFRLRLSCLTPNAMTFRSPPPRGTQASDRLTLDVVVPDDGTCDAQALELIAQSADGARAEGWFDNFLVS